MTFFFRIKLSQLSTGVFFFSFVMEVVAKANVQNSILGKKIIS